MRRSLRSDEVRLWAMVASTVRAAPGAAVPAHPAADVSAPAPPSDRAAVRPPRPPPPRRVEPVELEALRVAGVGSRPSAGTVRPPPPDPRPPEIEPNRRRRIARARDPIGGRLDLHGHDQDRARAALHAFLARAAEDGARAVLVITGKGRTGSGVLRARVPEWLGEPPARALVAGVSPAEARHGGEGALYVALKRTP